MINLRETFLFFSQNPREADAMTKVQAELDETKIILVNSFFHTHTNDIGYTICAVMEYWTEKLWASQLLL